MKQGRPSEAPTTPDAVLRSLTVEQLLERARKNEDNQVSAERVYRELNRREREEEES
jgi:hypothetical protein